MKEQSQNHALARQALRALENNRDVSIGMDWADIFVDKILDDSLSVALGAAIEGIFDKAVLRPCTVVKQLCLIPSVRREVAALALRAVWRSSDIYVPRSDLPLLFNLVSAAPQYLLGCDGVEAISRLPAQVVVYRGQLHTDGPNPDGSARWAIEKEVANWFAAPSVKYKSFEPGWLLTATIPKSAVLGWFSKAEFDEVVIDLSQVSGDRLHVERGTCKKFPVGVARRMNRGVSFLKRHVLLTQA